MSISRAHRSANVTFNSYLNFGLLTFKFEIGYLVALVVKAYVQNYEILKRVDFFFKIKES